MRKSRLPFGRPGVCPVPYSGGSNGFWFQRSPSTLLSSVSPLSHVYAANAFNAAPAVTAATPAATGFLSKGGGFTGAGSPANLTNSTKKTFSIDNLLNKSKDVASDIREERKDLVYPRAYGFNFPGYAHSCYGISPGSPCLSFNSWTAPGFRLA